MKLTYKPTKEQIRQLAKDYGATGIIYTDDGFELVGVSDDKKTEIKARL